MVTGNTLPSPKRRRRPRKKSGAAAPSAAGPGALGLGDVGHLRGAADAEPELGRPGRAGPTRFAAAATAEISQEDILAGLSSASPAPPVAAAAVRVGGDVRSPAAGVVKKGGSRGSGINTTSAPRRGAAAGGPGVRSRRPRVGRVARRPG